MGKYIITGANGLLGKEIICQTLEHDDRAEFLAISNNCEKLMQQFGADSRIRCCSWTELEHADLKDFTAAIHCAFSRSENGVELHKALVLTDRLLDAVGRAGVPAIVISSRSIYGQEDTLPWTEETEVGPNSLYALAKDAEELLTRQAARFYGSKMTVIRLAGLIGIGMDARIVSKMTKSAVENHSIKVVGGKQMFAMLDLRDAASGICALLKLPPEQWAETYNLGSGITYTLAEMAQVIAEVGTDEFGLNIKITNEKKDITLLDGMDCRLFYKDTGWRPAHSLRDTVITLYSFYLNA